MIRFFIVLLFYALSCRAQQREYTTSNAHSHNDYEKPVPFNEAYDNEFGSIEADIFLHKGKLIVAHDSIQLIQLRTLDSLYLNPLSMRVESNGGNVYADKKKRLQLMIDIKSDSLTTLDKLVEVLKKFPSLIRSPSLKIVISGNRPDPSRFSSYPSWIWFDGELQKDYSQNALTKIVMLSDNYSHYANDSSLLRQYIAHAHRLGKKVRFWNAPDSPESWKFFMGMGVDYINTDKIDELSDFLKTKGR